MDSIYLDNAATSYPKPPEVAEAVYEYMTNIGTNINRGGYRAAYDAEGLVYETRELLADMFGASDCKNVVFTKNVTESLNTVLKGLLRRGDHLLCSSVEHNAVMRPLVQLTEKGISFDRIPSDACGAADPDSVCALIRADTKAIVMTHASNVTGTINSLSDIGRIAHDHGIRFIVDAAQTAGLVPIDMAAMHIDALCFTGHKSLLGPQGIGGFILAEDMIDLMEPIISGGTGSISHTEDIPPFMPDKFEAGTMNLPGIAGLNAALKWIIKRGLNNIYAHETALTERFLDEISHLEAQGKIRIIGLKGTEGRVGVVSLQTIGIDCADAAYRLDSEYGIATRVGLHCAPAAHKAMGTYPTGTVRFSFGAFNTDADVSAAASALRDICT